MYFLSLDTDVKKFGVTNALELQLLLNDHHQPLFEARWDGDEHNSNLDPYISMSHRIDFNTRKRRNIRFSGLKTQYKALFMADISIEYNKILYFIILNNIF